MTIFLGGWKSDRKIILGVVIEHILYLSILQKNFAGKYYKMATLQQFSRGMLNLKRSAARTITGANLKLEKRKKIYIICMSVASEPRREFYKY